MSVASDATSDAGEERERNSLDISMRALRNLKDALENDSVRAHRRGSEVSRRMLSVAALCALEGVHEPRVHTMPHLGRAEHPYRLSLGRSG